MLSATCHYILGSINCTLQCMKEHGVCKFVFSSSATVYGTPQYLPLNEDHPVGCGITNPYGKSKFFIEEIVKDLCKAETVISLAWILKLFSYPGVSFVSSNAINKGSPFSLTLSFQTVTLNPFIPDSDKSKFCLLNCN